MSSLSSKYLLNHNLVRFQPEEQDGEDPAMVPTEFFLDLESDILIGRLTEYRRPGLAIKRQNFKDFIMAMKLDLLCNERNCPDMKSDVFTRFFERDPKLKHQENIR